MGLGLGRVGGGGKLGSLAEVEGTHSPIIRVGAGRQKSEFCDCVVG